MPLLSNKLYVMNRTRKEGGGKREDAADARWVLVATGEVCESAAEMARKTWLYEQKVWTCRCTGQTNLSFREASKSEAACARTLKGAFKRCWEAAVLTGGAVHHSRDSLDTLVHRAWTRIHEELCEGEPVTISITTPRQMTLKGVVVKVDRSHSNDEKKETEKSPNKLNSDASSSDKENVKKKIIPVKKNYFYSVKINEMDKLVKDIPAESIDRTLRPPSKDQIRMFIRAHAIRHSGKQNYPWVVDEEFVKRYRLPTLEPDFIVDKEKMRQLSRSTEIQVYNKLKEEQGGRDETGEGMCVDLTGMSDDDENGGKAGAKQSRGVANNTSNTSANTSKKQRTLKQATLFDIATGGSQSVTTNTNRNSGSSMRSPLSSPTRSLPPLAQRLLKIVKDSPNDPSVRQLIFKCCQLFSIQQINKFPDIIKIPIKERKEKLEEKKRLDAMTPAERDAYLTAKRNQIRQQLREKKREENAKVEDNEIEDATELPSGTPVPVPGQLSHDQWARLVSVSEFVRCYKRLLLPHTTNSGSNSLSEAGTSVTGTIGGESDGVSGGRIGVLSVNDLCLAVIGGSDKQNSILSDLICVLLKTLLQDNLSRNHKEMGLNISELPVTACTAGELLRVILPVGNTSRKSDEADNENTDNLNDNTNMDNDQSEVMNGSNVNNNTTIQNNINMSDKICSVICGKLETREIHDLSVEEKISVLEELQGRILELDIVSSFIDDYQKDVCEAYKKKVSDTKELNDKLRTVRLSRQNMSRCVLAPTVVLTEGQNGEKLGEEASQVVRRRQSIEQKQRESEEKERRLERERQLQKLEKEEVSTKKALDNCQKAYLTAVSDARQLMRVSPLGCDRHFRRYWYFPSAPGSLFIETELSTDANTSTGTENECLSRPSTRWHQLTTPEELSHLISCLCDKGIRESLLKSELESILPKLKEEFQSHVLTDNQVKPLAETNEQQSSTSSSDGFLVDGFKQELRETEVSIRQGSLGGVEHYDEWSASLDDAQSLAELKQSLVCVFLGVHERFWNPPLRSSHGRAEFLTAVESAATQSRLNLLQSFLDACVCWSKSAKDDKCRVCRKNSDEHRMLLCDSCNHAFHTFCLRPALMEIPDGEWFCPHCRPAARARDHEDASNTNTNSASHSTNHTSSTNQSNNTAGHNNNHKNHSQSQQSQPQSKSQPKSSDTACCVCLTPSNQGEQLAKCGSCKKSYHAQCHEPALRQVRRTNWHCSSCRLDENHFQTTNNTNSQSKSKSINDSAPSQHTQKNKNKDKMEEIEEEEEDEEMEKKDARSLRRAARKQSTMSRKQSVNGVVNARRKRKQIDKEYEEEQDQESEEEEEEIVQKIKRSDKKPKKEEIKKTLPPSRKRSKLEREPEPEPEIEEESDEEEEDKEEDKDESDQDVDNLSSLLKNKRSNLKRRAASGRSNDTSATKKLRQSDQSQTSNVNGGAASSSSSSVGSIGASNNLSKNESINDGKIDKACQNILRHMLNHKCSWPFRDRVNEKEVPDYYQIVAKPINICEMMEKQKSGVYRSTKGLERFLDDIRLMFSNAELYNLPDSEIMKLAMTLEDFFISLYNKYDLGLEYSRTSEDL